MNIVKKLRDEKNITQNQLAKEMGVMRQTISAIERGSNPRVELLKRLAEYFGVTTDYILGLDESNTA